MAISKRGERTVILILAYPTGDGERQYSTAWMLGASPSLEDRWWEGGH